MLENYPKTKIELPAEFKEIYNEHYRKNRDGATLASFFSRKMEAWLHKKVAEDVRGTGNKYTLEIGAGTLNQLEFENTQPYDIVEPYKELYIDSKYKSFLNEIFSDIDEVRGTGRYDRIISVATFEHITDLPKVVAKTCILLKKEGTLRVSIPNEGTFLWKLAWRLTTGIEFRLKYRLDYGILMKYEHINTANEIENILNFFYDRIRCSCFGLNKRVALYRFYECSEPKPEVAKKYLLSKNMLSY